MAGTNFAQMLQGPSAQGFSQMLQDPRFQFGLGMLSANQGMTGDEAFRAALGGGMSGALRSQTAFQDIARQRAATQIAEQQAQQAARQMEQQRQFAAAAPQLAPALMSQDPEVRRQAWSGMAGMMPQMLPAIAQMQMRQPMAAAQPMPSGLSREEFLKEYQGKDYTPASFVAALQAGDPGLLETTPKKYGFAEETSMRKEASTRIEPIRTAVQQAKQLDALLDRKGPFSDVASVYSLIRFLDPGSVVREGEIGIVSAAQGIWNQVQGMLQQAQGQGFLTDAMREDLRGMLGELTKLYRQQYQNFKGYYETAAGQYEGISPERVTGAPIIFPDLKAPRGPQAVAQEIPATPSLEAALSRNR